MHLRLLLLALVGRAAADQQPVVQHCSTLVNDENMGYTANLGIGSPQQFVTAIPDTGSSDLMILDAEADCTRETGVARSREHGCGNLHKGFYVKRSSTASLT